MNTTINKVTCLIILILSFYSCSTSKMSLNIPNDQSKQEITIEVKGTKGKGFVGTKRNLRFDKYYKGKLKEGWTISSDIVDKSPFPFFSKESMKRTLYENLGVDIDDITSKRSDKFQFTISDSLNTWLALCSQKNESKSTNYNILNRVDFSKGKAAKSDFNVNFFVVSDSLQPQWKLELKFDVEIPDGFTQNFLKEGMAIDNGHISNGTDTIIIKPLFLRGKEIEKNQYADMIKIVGGYEFIYNDIRIGRVDLYKTSITLSTFNNSFNSILTVAATAILLRNR